MSDEQPKGYLAKYGARLLDAGYRVLPIPKGDKSPPKDKEFGDWRKVKATQGLIREWVGGKYSRSGIGIDTRNAPLVDLDILDQAAVEHMKQFVFDRLGLAPVRIGRAPKAGIAFRCDSSFPKIQSKDWVDEWSPELDKHGQAKSYRVEVLAEGQQYVAFAIHPDTGKPYRWTENGSILTTAREDLPVITQEDAQAICDEFDRYAEEQGWEVRGAVIRRLAGGTKANIDKDDVFANDSQKTDIPEGDLQRKLMLVPGAESYDTWTNIGMALWHQFDGEQKGLDMWHEWSCQATNYDADALDAKWETFDAQGKHQKALTARIIIKLADEQTKLIAVEVFREIKQKLLTADSTGALAAVCVEIKHIEFADHQRAELTGVVARRWKNITDSPLPIASARAMTRYERPPVTEPPGWLKHWVYVQLDSTFYNTKTRQSIKVQAFDHSFGRNMLSGVERAEGKSIPAVSASAFALNSIEVDTFVNRLYHPGQGTSFSVDGLEYVNSYSDANVPAVPETLSKSEQRAIQRIEDHVHLLFSLGDAAETLINAMAWVVQNPGEKLKWAPLLQGQEGDGKTFFAAVLGCALGPENVFSVHARALEEKFNGWAEGHQVVFLEEAKMQGHNKFDVLNAIKPLITNDVVTIRRMTTDHYNTPNVTTYFITSNHRDALPLDENTTRYYPMFSSFQTKEAHDRFKAENPNYYRNLFATLEHDGAIRKWLLSRVIPKSFDGKDRAPVSPYMSEMISYTETTGATALRDVLTGRGALDPVLLTSHAVSERMQDDGVDPVPFGPALARVLREGGFTRIGKIWLEGKTPYFWSRTPARFLDKSGRVNQAAVREYIKWGDL